MICNECPDKNKRMCQFINILPEDIQYIFKDFHLHEIKLKKSILTKQGIEELYTHVLSFKRQGQYLAIPFSNFPCKVCPECSINNHLTVGYKRCSNRKLISCVGILNIKPTKDEYTAFILLRNPNTQ